MKRDTFPHLDHQPEQAPALALGLPLDLMTAFHSEPPELDFIWPGFLAGTVGALVAPGATGKSFWALQAAMAVACGVPGGDLLGLEPAAAGKVVYLAGEDPEPALLRRAHAIGRHLTADAREEIAMNLQLLPVMGLRLDVMKSSHLHSLIQLCSGARLVVLDTLSRVHGLDENSNGDMARLVSQLEHIAAQTGAAVLYLHHVSKGSAREGQADQQQAARGASALIDNARWQGFVQRMSEDEAKKLSENGALAVGEQRGYYVRWGVPKQNYSEPVTDRWYRRHDGGVLLPVELAEVGVGAAAPSKAKRKTTAAAAGGYAYDDF